MRCQQISATMITDDLGRPVSQYYNPNTGQFELAADIPGSGVMATPYSGTTNMPITAAATTPVKSGPGVIGTITNSGTATSGTVTVYDSLSASGNKVWSGTLTAGQVLPLGIPCTIGITIVTAAANTLLVSYA